MSGEIHDLSILFTFDTTKSKALVISQDCIKGSVDLFVMIKSPKHS